jgi:hypothetical protein
MVCTGGGRTKVKGGLSNIKGEGVQWSEHEN